MVRLAWLGAGWLLLGPALCLAQGFPTVTPLRMVDGHSPPVVDGELDDEIWRHATRVDDFHQIAPVDHGPPSELTEAYLAYDADHFYVGVRLHDSQPERVSAKGLIQGQTFFSDDRFEVRFDTFNDRRNAYFFQSNPNGMRREALVGNDYFIEEWDTLWFAMGKRQPWGWSLEMAIPFKSMSFDPATERWGFNLSRVIPRKGEEVTWSSRERRLHPAVSGYVDGMTGMAQGRGIELQPALVLRAEEQGDQSDHHIEPSLTGFYNLTPFLTAGLTLNTDFSATEVDDRQVNLSRFSLFFPEKREFFLQDAGIFEFSSVDVNGRPFFSRRIGLDDGGNPLDLRAGIKLTGRMGQWNVGALAVNQEAGVEGGSENLFVGRFSRNVLDQSTVGGIVTYGDPLSAAGNALVGVDFNYRNSSVFGSRNLEINTWLQRTDTDGVGGDAGGITINYPNDRFQWSLDYRRIEQAFNPALGFVSRPDTEAVDGFLRYRHRLSEGPWQWLGGRLQYFRADRLSGSLQSERWYVNVLEGFGRQRDFFTFYAGQETENLMRPFEIIEGVVIPPGRYAFDRYGVYVEAAFHRALSGSMEWTEGAFFNGRNEFQALFLDYRPNRHLLLGAGYSVNRIELPDARFTTRLIRLRGDVAFNAHWAWLNLAQYDNLSDRLGLNSRLRWLPRPDREYFVVLDKGSLRGPDGEFRSERTELSVKLEFIYRF